MKKLSELSNDTMLKVGDEWDLMTKGELLKSEYLNSNSYPEFPAIYTIKQTVVSFDLYSAIESMGEGETHEDWLDCVWNSIKASELNVEEIQNKINSIFENEPTYWEDEEVEMDINVDDIRYECIKEMQLPLYKRKGLEPIKDSTCVYVGSKWKLDNENSVLGCGFHLKLISGKSDCGSIEISWGEFQESFKLIS